MESAGETKPADLLVHPKDPQRRSLAFGTQAAATPLRPAQTAANSAGGKRRSGRPQTHRQTTARTHRSEPSLPAKRSAPGHANHQRPNAKRQGTNSRSDQTEDAKAEHERTTEAKGEAHRRTPGHAPHGGHPARQKQRRRRQTHRLRDRQRTKDRHRHRSRKARPAPEQTTRRAQETLGNHGSRTHRRRRQAKPTPPGQTGTKHRNSRKDPKTRSKQMVVGGKLLEAQEMRGRKLPINPVYSRKIPINSANSDQIPSPVRFGQLQERAMPDNFR
jgi:hypothetical protein